MRPHPVRRILTALAVIPLAALVGCSGGSCGCTPAPPVGSVSLSLAGGVAEGVQAFTVAITKIEALGPGGWVEGSRVRTIADLAALGSSVQPMGGLSLPPGNYSALRFTFEAPASARLADGSTVAVAVPVPLATVPVTFSAGDLAAVDLAVLLDPGRSLQARNGGEVLRPNLRAVDRRRAGSLSGRLTESNGQPVAGAVVSVQWFEAFGEPRLLRRALTKADGTYTLDLLPYGVAQHLVSWTTAGVRAFEPRATAAFTPSAAQPTFTADLVVPPRIDTAAVSGALTPVAATDQADEVELTYGPIQAGTEATLFIVGTRIASVQAAETYAFGPFPQGSTYQLRVRRRTWAADGATTVVSRYGDDLGFLTGITNVVDFQF
ncbi:MAG: carboxypeptidase regulatory-like domain-containing protein [Holophagaceae bacterium]|nr:carboxypeptidase regulatory-like domain-containing protein [Holophagaceae bacterium]